EGSGNSVVATSYDKADLESQFQLLKDEQIDAVVCFSDDFELNFSDLSKKGSNNINFYYNGKSEGSSNCYSLLTGLVSTIYDGYTINTENGEAVEPNITGENYLMDQLMAMIFPAITAMMLFSSVVSICPSAVAGEKERGTIASILLTPTRKGEIAGGKILAISITALASGLTSFLGILFSMPQMMGSSLVGFDSFFSPVTIILLLFLVLTALLLFTAIGLLISSLCKSIREASTYLSSLMFLLTVAFFVISLLDTTSLAISFIPLADIVACMSLIISGADMGSYLPNFLITIGVNLVVSGALIYLVTLCFKSERIMFAQ
ncbi:MAG: ABC transporter permease, partial [Bacillota bacterium]|nr:ABC transporter permease [Bacillota bacterium]